MPRPRSSVLAEVLWLAYFLAVFVVLVNVLLAVLVRPHNFSQMIAIALAAIFAALVMIATRAFWTAKRGP